MEIPLLPEFLENNFNITPIINTFKKDDKILIFHIFNTMIIGGLFTVLYFYVNNNKKTKSKKEIILEEYLDKGSEELKNLSEEEIDDERLKLLGKEFIEEVTPSGLVKLSYDKENESFKYYSDENIPYKYLEVVSRLFTIKYNVKKIYINYIEELITARDIKFKKESTKKLTSTEKSIFALSNNKKLPENTNYYIIPEKSNKYLKLGKIRDLIENENIKKREMKIETSKKILSFKEFKKQQN